MPLAASSLIGSEDEHSNVHWGYFRDETAKNDDISDEELEGLYDKIDGQVAEHGLPADAELHAEIDKLNSDVVDEKGKQE